MNQATELIRKFVDGSGKSQQKIADSINISRPALSRYYNGQTIPSMEVFADIAKCCGYEIVVRKIPIVPKGVVIPESFKKKKESD